MYSDSSAGMAGHLTNFLGHRATAANGDDNVTRQVFPVRLNASSETVNPL